ncbi:MAG: proteasome accessory factor PafA2 family protein [Deltaproteobacteria bacterium]|nr:proteasome accessory factor PafA2 family protein [Deltaproteobacteria bacterium]
MSEQALFGIETEYAFLAESINDRPYTSLHRNIAAELFPLAQKRFASLPGGNNSGLFLGNGARFYLDAGNHPEYCTPECLTPEEGVRWLLSGDRVLADLVDELGKQHPGFRLALFRCNVDYSGNHAVWGCHESYSIESRQQTLAAALIPHLVSRIVITGAGGFDNLEGRDDSTAPTAGRFLISPRVPHFADTAMWAPGSPRALIHNRCEPLSHRRLDRLHLMCGESLCSQLGNYLKLGCTALVIKLAEAGAPELERLTFHDPLGAMDLYAADPSCTTTAPLLDGRDLSAIQVQRFYLEAAISSNRGRRPSRRSSTGQSSFRCFDREATRARTGTRGRRNWRRSTRASGRSGSRASSASSKPPARSITRSRISAPSKPP